jgi:carboxylesterase type B
MGKLANNGDTVKTYVYAPGTSIRGFLSSTGVANFLGINYAKISERFRNAILFSLDSPNGTVVDAVAYGSRCPQPRNAGRERRQHLYEEVESASSTPISEFDCLNLNIFAPPDAIGSPEKLPVVVWIHGGGFIFGDGGSEYGQ